MSFRSSLEGIPCLRLFSRFQLRPSLCDNDQGDTSTGEWVPRYVRDHGGWGRGCPMFTWSGLIPLGQRAMKIFSRSIVTRVTEISDLESYGQPELLKFEHQQS